MALLWRVSLLAGALLMADTSVALASHCASISDTYLKAVCIRQDMESTGALSPSGINSRQSSVPQYGGSAGCTTAACAGASGATLYSNTGDVSALNSAATTAIVTDPNVPKIQRMQTDAAGYTMTTNPAVVNANGIAGSMTPSASSKTCTDVPVCVSWAPGPPTTSTCTRPGAASSPCSITATTTAREVSASGGPGGTQGWCVDHYMYLRVVESPAETYTVQWRGTGPTGVIGENCGGSDWQTLVTFSFVPPVLTTNEQWGPANVQVSVSLSGQCGSGTQSVPVGQTMVLVCGASGAQTGSISVAGWTKSWVIRKDVIDDRCAGFRASGWMLQATTCTDSAPRSITAATGTVVRLLPPTTAPLNGCWIRTEQWGVVGSSADTCAPLLAAGCSEKTSSCTAPLPGGCNTYTVTMACGRGSVCTKTNIVKQCTSCGAPGSMVPYCTPTDTPPNTNFQQAATMMAFVQEVENGFDKSTMTIFNGTPKRCGFTTVGTVFVDCCADDPAQMLGTCSAEEISLANDKQAKQVVYVGDTCTSSVLGICMAKQQVYCTYTSMIGRIVQQQGKPQLGLTFGTPDVPECDGYTIAQFASLNFQIMDWTDFFSQVKTNFDQAAVTSTMKTKACAFAGTTC